MKPSHAADKKLIGRTREVWQPRLRRELTDEDARQIVENVTGFFSILAEWSRAAKPAPVDTSDVPASSNPGQVCDER
jgi:hypothetical protein